MFPQTQKAKRKKGTMKRKVKKEKNLEMHITTEYSNQAASKHRKRDVGGWVF